MGCMSKPPGIIAPPLFFSDFNPLPGTARDCGDCGSAERVGFQFDYAFQPIVDVVSQIIYAHEALARLCEEMRITWVAEGIGTAGERDFLRDAGIRLMQGYRIARPAFQTVSPISQAAFLASPRA